MPAIQHLARWLVSSLYMTHHACMPIPTLCVQEGKNYLAAMSCAANYAWVNRSSMTFLVRQAFQKMFKQQADDLDMHVVYDVSHNIAKVCVESLHPFIPASAICCLACEQA